MFTYCDYVKYKLRVDICVDIVCRYIVVARLGLAHTQDGAFQQLSGLQLGAEIFHTGRAADGSRFMGSRTQEKKWLHSSRPRPFCPVVAPLDILANQSVNIIYLVWLLLVVARDKISIGPIDKRTLCSF